MRQVRAEGEIIEVTYHGQVIARVVPVNPPAAAARDMAAIWTDLDQLTAEISAKWPESVSAVAAVREGRREL